MSTLARTNHLVHEQEIHARVHRHAQLVRKTLARVARRPRLAVQVDEKVVALRQFVYFLAQADGSIIWFAPPVALKLLLWH